MGVMKMLKNTQDDEKLGANGDCEATFVVEIKINSSEWRATPKIHHTIEDAKKEANALKLKYPYVRECRIKSQKQISERDNK